MLSNLPLQVIECSQGAHWWPDSSVRHCWAKKNEQVTHGKFPRALHLLLCDSSRSSLVGSWNRSVFILFFRSIYM